MRALVTGANGFIGAHVLAALPRYGISATTLGRRPAPGATDNRILVEPIDTATLTAVLRQVSPDIVLHLAGTTDTSDLAAIYQVNTVYAAMLLEAVARVVPHSRVVLLGSAAEYGPVDEKMLPLHEAMPCRPDGAYGISKLGQSLCGLAAAAAGGDIVVARLYNAIGAGMPTHLALGSFARQIVAMGPAGGTLRTGDLGVERDFVAATDVADIIIALAIRSDVPGVVDICSGVPTRLRDFVEALIGASEREVALMPDAVSARPTQRRHYGAGTRLAAMGLRPPSPDPDAMAAVLLASFAPGSFLR